MPHCASLLSLILSVVITVVAGHDAVASELWVEDTFEDFADGRLDAAGQNIYVSRDGTIRTIHRFDVNDDGYLDLFFGNTHDLKSVVEPTIAWLADDGSVKQKDLAIMGADAVCLADLNRDDYPDLVFKLTADGLQGPRRIIRIAYGGEDGWTSQRCTGLLPAHRPLSIAVVDLNADAWPDIAVFNSDSWISTVPTEKNIRIYWGSQDGFLLNRFQDIGEPDISSLAGGDLDGDGADDLIVRNRSGGVRVFWSNADHTGHTGDDEIASSSIRLPSGDVSSMAAADCDVDGHMDLVFGIGKDRLYLLHGRGGRAWEEAQTLSGVAATHISVGDLDGDEHPDLVLNSFVVGTAAGGEVTGAAGDSPTFILILWGDGDGYDPARSTKLPVKNAQSTAIGDLDGDGHMDLAVAIYQGDKTFEGRSLFYFGRGNRQFRLGDETVTTRGAGKVVIAPSHGNLPSQAVFTNTMDGTLYEQVPVYFYWGGPGGFDSERRWEVPAQSGHEATAADLNADGFTDLIIPYTGHGGNAALRNPLIGTNILWGSADGFDLSDGRSVLPESNPYMDTSNVADLNRDGFLDVAVGGWAETDATTIYYGAADGFKLENMVDLETEGRGQGVVIADFNRDDWLDLAVTSFDKNLVRIFRGSPDGFDRDRHDRLLASSPIGIETADLNADGWLDLIVANYFDKTNIYFDAGNFIFWGSKKGFSHHNSQWLPGNCTLYHAVADFDGDGFLDMFFPNYHSQISRDMLASYFYWGSAKGFHWQRRTPLICNSASGVQIGDFDHDGLIDLAVSNHTVYGDHNTNSQVVYNDGNRFARPRIQYLPTRGSHFMWIEDMGHIYNRQWRQTYDSSVFQLEHPASSGGLTYRANEPDGTKLTFLIRASPRSADLDGRAWRAVERGTFQLDEADRCLQYRVVFHSDNGDRFPVLDSVTIKAD